MSDNLMVKAGGLTCSLEQAKGHMLNKPSPAIVAGVSLSLAVFSAIIFGKGVMSLALAGGLIATLVAAMTMFLKKHDSSDVQDDIGSIRAFNKKKLESMKHEIKMLHGSPILVVLTALTAPGTSTTVAVFLWVIGAAVTYVEWFKLHKIASNQSYIVQVTPVVSSVDTPN